MNARRLPLIAAASAALLCLSACGIPGGIAQMVKTMENDQDHGNKRPAEAAPAPQPAAYQPDPPPAPAAAPRDAVQVETLPPLTR